MAVLDRIQGMFSKPQPHESVDLGQVADQELAQMAAASLAPLREAQGGNSRLGLPVEFAASEMAGDDNLLSVPLLGRRTAVQHRSILAILLGLALIVLATSIFFTLRETEKTGRQVAASGQALMQSQRLAKSVSQALVGSESAFPEVSESAEILLKSLKAFQSGDAAMSLQPLDTSFAPLLETIAPRVDAASRNAAVVLAQQTNLTQVSQSVRAINSQTADLLEFAETIASLKLQGNAPVPELSASSQMVMLTQRIGKSANELLTADGVSPEAVFLLGKDLNTFKEIGEGLLNGNNALRLRATGDPQIRENLEALLALFDDTLARAQSILSATQGLAEARAALDGIVRDSEPLRQDLQTLQSGLSTASGLSGRQLLILLGSALAALLCAGGLAYVQLQESRARQLAAESQRVAAESEEQDAKRVNDANQAAILRLMNELQTVAEGDLTQEATVTEDITGAIADSVNYTVEELRSLVGNVQATATRVAQTTSAVESTSTELLAASNEQLREIRETGQAVVDMAQRINQVSSQAEESASVARTSLVATEQGLQAVQNAIGGMNAIRDQIQETSKRIKRLGESSQEIGEITELISDITEQTNVLALNAAIQAASAGEAGRGFSVVAEEVQRLAERSGDATRQIAALVKTIQTDTQDAVGAMERSTQGVVEGAKLSDNAGAALSEIDRVSRRLADLIEQISEAASREANSANEVAGNIQHIFAVTEQTGEGTRSTAQQVRELSAMAEELRQSVSRFKIA
ncbi:MAG: methyl-accepting chemotaxis protein [Hydrogenophaga sp.]